MQIEYGYCALHDKQYRLEQDDEVCQSCLNDKKQDLQWREAENDLIDEETE